MSLSKKFKKVKINTGEWKKKLEISIPKYDFSIAVFKFPFKIGSSPNNDLVLSEDFLDLFQLLLTESGTSFRIFNISLHKEVKIDDKIIYPFEAVNIEKSISVELDKMQIMVMPEIKKMRIFKEHLSNLKQEKIECPYCGNLFEVGKSCSICGFGKDEVKNYYQIQSRLSQALKMGEFIEEQTIKRSIGGLKGTKLILTIENGRYKGKNIEIPENVSELTIGRSIYNTVSLSFLEDSTMSRFHCKLILEGDKVSILDNNSLNGTIVNGKVINGKVEIHSGDLIQIGTTVLRVNVVK